MLYGIALSGTSGQIERARLENVSNNLANVNTTGFKRDLLTVMSRPVESRDVQLPWEAERLFWQHDLLDRIGGGVHLNKTHTVHDVGPLTQTGNPQDLALTGEGFFELEEAGSGLTFYTRAGDFVVNQEGWLVTQDGQHFVQNSKGSAINIGNLMRENGATDFTVNNEGAIFIQNDAGTIQTGETLSVKVFEPSDMPSLVKIGGNRFHAPDEAKSRAKQLAALPSDERRTKTQVKQGFIEGSGVDPTTTMVEMIEVSRSFERNMKMLSLQDATLEDVIRRVGGL